VPRACVQTFRRAGSRLAQLYDSGGHVIALGIPRSLGAAIITENVLKVNGIGQPAADLRFFAMKPSLVIETLTLSSRIPYVLFN